MTKFYHIHLKHSSNSKLDVYFKSDFEEDFGNGHEAIIPEDIVSEAITLREISEDERLRVTVAEELTGEAFLQGIFEEMDKELAFA